MELVIDGSLANNWWIIVLVVVVLAILAFVLLRPRQRVELTDKTPTRPHMSQSRALGA